MTQPTENHPPVVDIAYCGSPGRWDDAEAFLFRAGLDRIIGVAAAWPCSVHTLAAPVDYQCDRCGQYVPAATDHSTCGGPLRHLSHRVTRGGLRAWS